MPQPPITGWVPRPTGSQPWDSQIPRDNRYYITTFGGGSDAQSVACRGMQRADGTWWYLADSQRFGCGTRVKITNPENGKSCVAITADIGPNISVERSAGGPVIDASPLVLQYLFGHGSYGWSDRVVVVAERVSSDMPVGPVGADTAWMTATTAGALLVMGGLAMWWMSKSATLHGRAGARRNSGSRKRDAAISADILRDRRTGQYSHGFDAVCACGHSKGSHLAEGTDCIVHEVPHTDADRAWVASHPDDICACTKFRKIARRRNPKRDIDKEAISAWAPGAKRRAEREKAQRDRWHEEHRGHGHLLAKQAQWEKLEGHWILRVPGRSAAALPATGKKNAARFVVFDMKTREELAQLNKDEVLGWLARETER